LRTALSDIGQKQERLADLSARLMEIFSPQLFLSLSIFYISGLRSSF
jgi:hypothetical protein